MDDALLTCEILKELQNTLNESAPDSPNAHEEGGVSLYNQTERATRGDSDSINLPLKMKNGSDPEIRFHVHPHSTGSPVQGRAGYVYKAEGASAEDKEDARSADPLARHYIITPQGKILKYDPTGVIEDLGTLGERIRNSCCVQ